MEQQVRNRRLGHSSRSRRKSVGIKLTFAKAKPRRNYFDEAGAAPVSEAVVA